VRGREALRGCEVARNGSWLFWIVGGRRYVPCSSGAGQVEAWNRINHYEKFSASMRDKECFVSEHAHLVNYPGYSKSSALTC
jgi:hypothetical protein